MTFMLSSKLRKGPIMTANDPKRPCWQMQQARSSMLCRMRCDWCYVAELYLIPRIFNKLRNGRALCIKFLNAHARSSGKTRVLPNIC